MNKEEKYPGLTLISVTLNGKTTWHIPPHLFIRFPVPAEIKDELRKWLDEKDALELKADGTENLLIFNMTKIARYKQRKNGNSL